MTAPTLPRMTKALCCLVLLIFLVSVAGAQVPGAAQPAVDKRAFNLFHPTPAKYLREMTRDGPGATDSPYTVDAGHFQVEMDLVSYTHDSDSSSGVARRFEAWEIAP